MQNKMKLLSRCKLLLYSTKTEIDNYTKTISLFKYYFSYNFKYRRKTNGKIVWKYPTIRVFEKLIDFFPVNFLINIVFYWAGYN